MAAVVAGMSPIRAEPCDATPLPVPSVQLDHEATLHAGYAVYSMLGGDHTVFAGPKLTLESGQRMTEHLWLDASLGLIFGSC